jgi:hypothetical protein
MAATMTSLEVMHLAIAMLKYQAENRPPLAINCDDQPKEAGTLNHD